MQQQSFPETPPNKSGVYEQQAWGWWHKSSATLAKAGLAGKLDFSLSNIAGQIQRHSLANLSQAFPLPRGCLFYIIVAFAIGLAIDAATTALLSSATSFSHSMNQQAPVMFANWLFITGRIFCGFLFFVFFIDWIAKFIGLSLLGGMITAIRRLFALFVFVGLTLAILSLWVAVGRYYHFVPATDDFPVGYHLIGCAIAALVVMMLIRIGYGRARGTFGIVDLMPIWWRRRFHRTKLDFLRLRW